MTRARNGDVGRAFARQGLRVSVPIVFGLYWFGATPGLSSVAAVERVTINDPHCHNRETARPTISNSYHRHPEMCGSRSRVRRATLLSRCSCECANYTVSPMR